MNSVVSSSSTCPPSTIANKTQTTCNDKVGLSASSTDVNSRFSFKRKSSSESNIKRKSTNMAVTLSTSSTSSVAICQNKNDVQETTNSNNNGKGTATIPKNTTLQETPSKPTYYDEVQKLLKETFKASMNPVSFEGKNNISSNNLPTNLQGALEIEMDPGLYCRHCKQLKKEYCHRVVYADYIKKKLFSIYSNKGRQPGSDEFREK